MLMTKSAKRGVYSLYTNDLHQFTRFLSVDYVQKIGVHEKCLLSPVYTKGYTGAV